MIYFLFRFFKYLIFWPFIQFYLYFWIKPPISLFERNLKAIIVVVFLQKWPLYLKNSVPKRFIGLILWIVYKLQKGNNRNEKKKPENVDFWRESRFYFGMLTKSLIISWHSLSFKKVYLLNLSQNYGEPAQLHFLGFKRENRVSHLITVTTQLINFRRIFRKKLTFAQIITKLLTFKKFPLCFESFLRYVPFSYNCFFLILMKYIRCK